MRQGYRQDTTIDAQREPSRADAWRTVSYYSEPYGRAIGFVVIYAPLAILLLCLSVGLVWFFRGDAMWVAIVFGILGTAGYFFLVPFHYRYSQEGIDRAQIGALRDVDLYRIEAEATVALAQADARKEQFALERERIQEGRNWIADRQPQGDTNRLSTYVPAAGPQASDAMVQEMMRWCERAHSSMSDDGRMTSTVPWAKAGVFGPTDSERAQTWLTLAANAMGHWIVRYDAARRGWYVNVKHYKDASDLIAALAVVSPPN